MDLQNVQEYNSGDTYATIPQNNHPVLKKTYNFAKTEAGNAYSSVRNGVEDVYGLARDGVEDVYGLAKDGVEDVYDLAKDGVNKTKNELNSFNYRDFYASNPDGRHTVSQMQSPNLIDNFNNMSSQYNHPYNSNDISSIVIMFVFLVLFVWLFKKLNQN
jgi:hypothetical protein